MRFPVHQHGRWSGLTSARKLADELQSGSLPIKLEPISPSRASAAASP
jgi:preprotein translocase subunit SecD